MSHEKLQTMIMQNFGGKRGVLLDLCKQRIAGLSPALNLPVPIYTPRVERGTVRVKFLAQEHNTMFLAMA